MAVTCRLLMALILTCVLVRDVYIVGAIAAIIEILLLREVIGVDDETCNMLVSVVYAFIFAAHVVALI